MKVVLFCGGLGMCLREHSEVIPKPMVEIGYRPILWHVMKYYAYYGHKEFILCLGYKADIIKSYFVNYDEAVSNDFVLSHGGKKLQLLARDIDDWKITFVDTGLNSNIGQRLKQVEKYLEGEEMFLANYSDGLTDLHLPDLIDFSSRRDKIASFVSVKPTYSFHVVSAREDGIVRSIDHLSRSGLFINGGYFVLKNDIFQYLSAGEELVGEAFEKLIEEEQLISYRHDGFWAAMDTFKDKQQLDEMYALGIAPWEAWKRKAVPNAAVFEINARRPALVGAGQRSSTSK
jgi:glucose-1-phosphate cytidylyltransferase